MRQTREGIPVKVGARKDSRTSRFEWEASLPNLFRVQMAVRRDYVKAARCGRFVLWRRDVVNRGATEGNPGASH